MIALLQVVPGAEQLHIGSGHGRAALCERENVIKVQLVDCATNRALRSVAFPDFELDVRRDDAPSLCVHVDGLLEVFIPLDGDQLEHAHRSELVAFGPSIHEVEDAVVRPDSRANLFVYPHSLRRPTSGVGGMRRGGELPILCGSAAGVRQRLIYDLRIGA